MRDRRWLIGLLVTAPVLPLAVWFFGSWWVLGGRTAAFSFLDRQQAAAAAHRRQAGYRAAGKGLVAELASGRVGPGHSLDDLLSRFPPERVLRFRRFIRVVVRDGPDGLIDLWAKDGRLVQAGRGTDPARRQPGAREPSYDEFFGMSPADEAARSVELTAVYFDRRDAAMATVGPAAYISLHDRHTLP